MEDYGEWIADRARIRQQVAAKGQQHPKQKRAAEKGNGSKQKEQVNPAQVLISNGPTLSMHEGTHENVSFAMNLSGLSLRLCSGRQGDSTPQGRRGVEASIG